MSGYTPVFDTVFDGTLCGRWPTLPVWLTILPMADKHGHIDITYQAIAARTGWPIDLLKQAISELTAPDPESRTDEHEGRRLIPLDENRSWGWQVVNHDKYREKARLAAKSAREVEEGKNKDRMADRHQTADDRRSPPPTPSPNSYSYSNSYSDKNKRGEESRAKRSTAQRLSDEWDLTPERRKVAEAEGVDPARELSKFRDHWLSASGASARKHDWDAAWRNWCRKSADFRPARKTSEEPVITWRPPPDEEQVA